MEALSFGKREVRRYISTNASRGSLYADFERRFRANTSISTRSTSASGKKVPSLEEFAANGRITNIMLNVISRAKLEFGKNEKDAKKAAEQASKAANALIGWIIDKLGYEFTPETRSLVAARLCFRDANEAIMEKTGYLSYEWNTFYHALAKHFSVENHTEAILTAPEESVMGGVQVRIAYSLPRELAIRLSKLPFVAKLDDSLSGYILQYNVTEYGDRHPQFKPKTGENQPPKPRAAPAEPAATV